MSKIRGVTLLELMIVIIILGILAILAIPQYTKFMERARSNEAITTLRLIAAAEQGYKLANRGLYYPPGLGPMMPGYVDNLTAINSALRISIPNNNDWNYAISSLFGLNPIAFFAVADRTGSGPYSSCTYSIGVGPANNTTIPDISHTGNCP